MIWEAQSTSVHLLVCGSNEEAMESCRRDPESQVGMGRREKLVIERDFNANAGRTVSVKGCREDMVSGNRMKQGWTWWSGVRIMIWRMRTVL